MGILLILLVLLVLPMVTVQAIPTAFPETLVQRVVGVLYVLIMVTMHANSMHALLHIRTPGFRELLAVLLHGRCLVDVLAGRMHAV